MPSENLRAFSQGIFLYILSKKNAVRKSQGIFSGHFFRAFSYISLVSLDVTIGHFLIYPQ